MGIYDDAKQSLVEIYEHTIINKLPYGYNFESWINNEYELLKPLTDKYKYMEDKNWIKVSWVTRGCPANIKLTTIGIDIVEDNFEKAKPPPNNTTFNIQENKGVVASHAENFTINSGINFSEIEAIINSKLENSEEKTLLMSVLKELQENLASNKPIEKGMLAKISSSLQNHGWLASPLANILLRYVGGLPL